jgi:hypothetical protein
LFTTGQTFEQIDNNKNKNMKNTVRQSLHRETNNDLIDNAEIESDGRISFSYERDDRQSFGFTRESYNSTFTEINYDAMDEEQLVRHIAYTHNSNDTSNDTSFISLIR